MDLRQDNGDAARSKLVPDALKSDKQEAKDDTKGALDTVASYIPGQEKTRDHITDGNKDHSITHDTGRQGDLDAFKPSGEQTTGEVIQNKVDQGLSYVQPDKSKSQEARDTVTPGHHSEAKAEGKGLVEQVGDAIVGAKDAVVDALGGHNSGTRS